VAAPTYPSHAAAWRAAGHTVHETVAGTAAETVAESGVVVVGHPNNPDGRLWPRAELLACADRLAASGGLLVVDEAFADAAPGTSLAPHAGRPGLLILRSTGKILGRPGVRLGFVLAPEAWRAPLAAALGPWAVSGPALALAAGGLAATAWLHRQRERLRAEAVALDALLARHGLPVVGGTPLFRLARAADAPALAERLAARGVLVRTFAHDARWLRVGLPGTGDAWRRLDEALAGAAVRRR
jgi:cobalamin biosynthetic protein CobC